MSLNEGLNEKSLKYVSIRIQLLKFSFKNMSDRSHIRFLINICGIGYHIVRLDRLYHFYLVLHVNFKFYVGEASTNKIS